KPAMGRHFADPRLGRRRLHRRRGEEGTQELFLAGRQLFAVLVHPLPHLNFLLFAKGPASVRARGGSDARGALAVCIPARFRNEPPPACNAILSSATGLNSRRRVVVTAP